jgi:hypothetical protein
LIAGLWLLAFWLAAALGMAPRIERQLAGIATALTRELPTGYSAPEVHFEGQTAIVSGRVRREIQRAEIITTVKEKVRASSLLGSGLNPVLRVADALEIEPYPPGWLMIAANGPRGQLLGTAATEYEARDLATLMGQSCRFPEPRAPVATVRRSRSPASVAIGSVSSSMRRTMTSASRSPTWELLRRIGKKPSCR